MKFRLLLIGVLCLSLAFFLIGCGKKAGDGAGVGNGNGNGDVVSTMLTGIAAAGAPIIGTINVKGANGELSLGAIESDGSFSVDVAALTAPFVVWAKGTANGKSVTVYSTISDVGYVNVTPATHAVMAMALGDDPETHFEADGAVPSGTSLAAAKQAVIDIMSSIFTRIDLAADFDVMSDAFTADGSGFDSVLNAVSMETDPNGDTLTFTDNASGAELYKQTMSEGVPAAPTAISSTDVDIVTAGMNLKDTIMNILNKLETLYADSLPTLAELEAVLSPVMAEDFLAQGGTATDMLEAWADSQTDDGPPVGFKVLDVSIHRPMKILTLGDDYYEMGDNYKGVWAGFLVELPGGHKEWVGLDGFVQKTEGAEWKWWGDRRIIMEGDNLRARMIYEITPTLARTTRIHSGLDFYTEDRGNVGLLKFGLSTLEILNPALPLTTDQFENTANVIVMGRVSDENPTFEIKNVANPYWGFIYTEDNGLDISTLTDPEFMFLAKDAGGAIVGQWVDLLTEPPIPSSSLTAADFPQLTSPIPFDLAGLNIPGPVDLTWTNPEDKGQYTNRAHLGWGDNQQGMDWMDINNPCEAKESLGQAVCTETELQAWTSQTFDTNSTQVLPAENGWVEISNSDEYDREFSTHISNWR